MNMALILCNKKEITPTSWHETWGLFRPNLLFLFFERR